MKPIILIPYRDRSAHLAAISPVLRDVFPEAEIHVIEQANDLPFNKGVLFNAGVSLYQADYYALHDVDMVPEANADYSPPTNPTLMATKCSQFGYKMPSSVYVGGVVLITREQFIKACGFSNRFWGWGGEDDEFGMAVRRARLVIDKRDTRY